MPVQLSGSLLMSGSITATGLISAQGGISSVGAQQITDLSNAISFTSTASLYTDGGIRVTKDMFVSGTAYFNNVTIYGTQSVEYITSSQLNIGTNIITVNTDTPTVRYGGLAVYDSGSTGLTGSLLWDSEANHWIYTNPSGSTYSGGMMISGPRASARGCEQGTTSCALMVGQGGDHITSSGIFHYGNATCFYGNSTITNTGVGCFAGTICAPTVLSSGTICSTGNTCFGGTVILAGNVGIGTASPTVKLHVSGSGTTYGKIEGVGNNTTGLLTKNGGREYFTGTYYNVTDSWEVADITAGGLTRLAINTSGNVGIGCNTPTNSRLLVAGTHASGNSILGVVPVSNNVATIGLYNSSGVRTALFYSDTGFVTVETDTDPLLLRTAGTNRLSISSTGIACFACQTCTPALDIMPSGAGVNTAGGILRVITGGTAVGIGVGQSNTNRYTQISANDLLVYNDDFFIATRCAFPLSIGTCYTSRLTFAATGIACFACQVCMPVLLASGCVGIGTTSPTATLDIGSAKTLSGTDPISVYTDVRVQSAVTGGLIGYNLRMVGLSPAVGSYTIANMYGLKTNTPVVQPNVTVTNSYGVYIGRTDDPSSGGVVTNKYALVTEAAAGNVGIGTTTPTYTLDVFNSTEANLRVKTSSTTGLAGLYIGNGNRDYSIITRNSVSNVLEFRNETANNTVMAISGSNVGIGTTSPAYNLDVAGNIGITGNFPIILNSIPSTTSQQLHYRNNGTTKWQLYLNTANDSFNIYNSTNTTDRLTILENGNVGIGTTAPDSLLHVLNCSNTPYSDANALASGQWFRISNPSTCTGATSGLLFVAQGPSGGNGLATINGVTTSCGSMAITFGTRDASGNVTERMRIASNGKVGIGETTPDNTYQGLTIKGSDPSLRLKTTGVSGWTWVEFVNCSGTNNFSMGVNQTQPHFVIKAGAGMDSPHFSLGSTGVTCFACRVCMPVLLASGCVGIGTTSPTSPLTIRCDSSSTAALIEIATCSANSYRYVSINAGSGISYCIPAGTSQSPFIEVQGGIPAFGGGSFKIRTGAMGSVADRVIIGQDGIACFSSTVCMPVLLASGCVGIGTTSPATNLIVEGTNRAFPLLYNTGYGNVHIQTNETTATQNFGGSLTFGGLGRTSGPTEKFIWAAIAGRKEVTTSGDPRGYLQFGTTDDSTNEIKERMRITSCGSVGIGTTSTSAEANLFLGAQGTIEGGQLVLQKGTSCSCATHLDNYNDSFRIMSGTNTGSTFVNMTIDHKTGYVGIGTFPSYQLDVQLPSGVNGQILRLGRSAGAYFWSLGIDSSGSCLNFYNNSNTSVAVISPVTGVYTATSDCRVKSNITDSCSVLDKILQLKVRQYIWNESCERENYGLIAQEVSQVLPQYVKQGDENTNWGISKSEFVPALIKAIQEQQCIINTLKTCLGII